MASGDILHQNKPNLATLGTSLGFMSAFSVNYAVCSLPCLTEAGIHFAIPQEKAGKERGGYTRQLSRVPYLVTVMQFKQNYC